MNFRSLLIALVVMLGAAPVFPAPVRDRHVEAELVAERTAWLPGVVNAVALRLKPDPGWHTYWRNPGDSGLPTTLKWTLPTGWTAGEIEWPYPQVQKLGDLVNYGYGEETLHLVALQAPAKLGGESMTVKAEAKWLMCSDICIPGKADLELRLPVSEIATVDPRWAAAFEDAHSRLPRDGTLAGNFAIADGEFRLQVQSDTALLAGAERAEFFPYASNLVNHGAAQRSALETEGVRFTQALSSFFETPAGAVEGVLVVHGPGTQAYNVAATPVDPLAIAALPAAVTVPAPVIEPAIAAVPPDLALIFLFALLGGLILNLMPCVFPVLAIKAVAVIESHRDEKSHALAYAAGVVLSCVVIAGLLLGLRAAGQELGWGFQLQSPVFVALMAYLIFAFGLSMSGLLEFGTALMGVGQSLTEKPGYSGSFFTGILAVVVASPCTAPFMGTSLGFALTQPAPLALLIFATLGFGLALPFLLLGFFPVLGRWLPKPGAWMETFKQLMAFPLYLTVVWLVWVLSGQAGHSAGALVLCGLVLLAFALWLIGRGGRFGRWAGYGVIVLAAALLFHPVLRSTESRPALTGAAASQVWSEARVAALRAEGRSVFVNFTADWCITCKVNEKVALDTDAVKSAFAAKNVTWLVGDWTNADPEISKVLERFSRPGVPLYLLYAPTGEPEVLPQLLTPDTVIEAINRLP